MSDQRINSITTSNYIITPELNYYGNKIRVKFIGSCLIYIIENYIYSWKNNKYIYIVYEISRSNNISNYAILENCLFGAVSLTKHADIDQHKYSGYGIGFDRKG